MRCFVSFSTHQRDGHQQNIPTTVMSPYTATGYCSPSGMSPNGYFPSPTSSFQSMCATTNGHFPSYEGSEAFSRDLYQNHYKLDSYRNYTVPAMVSKSYVPHQTTVQKHSYRNIQPLVYNSVISYASPSATQIGTRLLPGCRGS